MNPKRVYGSRRDYSGIGRVYDHNFRAHSVPKVGLV